MAGYRNRNQWHVALIQLREKTYNQIQRREALFSKWRKKAWLKSAVAKACK